MLCRDGRCQPASQNLPPAVTLLPVGRGLDALTVEGVVSDPEGQTVQLELVLQKDGEALEQWTRTVRSSPSGTEFSATLDVAPLLAITPLIDNATLEVLASDGEARGALVRADGVQLGNHPPTIEALELATSAPGTISGLVLMTFRALDSTADPIQVHSLRYADNPQMADAVEIALDDAESFPVGGLRGIETLPGGRAVSIAWDSSQQAAVDATAVWLGLTVTDRCDSGWCAGVNGTSEETVAGPFELDNAESPPEVRIGELSGPHSGNVTVPYELIDVDGDTCTITPEFSLDNGTTWQRAPTPSNLVALPAGSPNQPHQHEMIWNSTVSTSGQHPKSLIRLRAFDGTFINGAETGPFEVDNRQASGQAPALDVAFRAAMSEPFTAVASGGLVNAFGVVEVGESESVTFRLKSSGELPLDFPDAPPVEIPAQDGASAFVVEGALPVAQGSALDVGEAVTVNVRFGPEQPGIATQYLIIRTSDPSQPEFDVTLLGSGQDTTPPVIDNKEIWVTGVERDRFSVEWEPANDALDGAELDYTLLIHDRPAFSTLEEVQANGTVLATRQGDGSTPFRFDYTPAASPNGFTLEEGSAYYVNVIVSDTADNEAVYQRQQFTTKATFLPLEGDWSDPRVLGGTTHPESVFWFIASKQETDDVEASDRLYKLEVSVEEDRVQSLTEVLHLEAECSSTQIHAGPQHFQPLSGPTDLPFEETFVLGGNQSQPILYSVNRRHSTCDEVHSNFPPAQHIVQKTHRDAVIWSLDGYNHASVYAVDRNGTRVYPSGLPGDKQYTGMAEINARRPCAYYWSSGTPETDIYCFIEESPHQLEHVASVDGTIPSNASAAVGRQLGGQFGSLVIYSSEGSLHLLDTTEQEPLTFTPASFFDDVGGEIQNIELTSLAEFKTFFVASSPQGQRIWYGAQEPFQPYSPESLASIDTGPVSQLASLLSAGSTVYRLMDWPHGSEVMDYAWGGGVIEAVRSCIGGQGSPDIACLLRSSADELVLFQPPPPGG